MYFLLICEPPFNEKKEDETKNVKTKNINYDSKKLRYVSIEGKDLLKQFLERNTKKEFPLLRH